MKNRLILFLLRVVLWRIVWLWCFTLRITKIGAEAFESAGSSNMKYVAAFWHGSMLVGWFMNRPRGKGKISALVSQSKDGEYLSHVLQPWGYTMIRGSSHIGGKEAMQLMTDSVKNGNSLCITPDGPRGPRHEMKMGAIRVAQKTGVPLFLCGVGMKRKKQLKSWDKFEIPFPFSSVAICYSEPIAVPENYSGDSLDAFKVEIEKRLCELQQKAESML